MSGYRACTCAGCSLDRHDVRALIRKAERAQVGNDRRRLSQVVADIQVRQDRLRLHES